MLHLTEEFNLKEWVAGIVLLSQTKTPLLSSAQRGETAFAEEVEYFTTKQLPHKGKITAAVADDSTSSVVVSEEIANRITPRYIIMIGGEKMLVTAVNKSTKTLTVTRGYASTPATSHLINSEVIVLNKAEADGTITKDFVKLNKVRSTNYIQEFTKTIEISSRALRFGKKDYVDVKTEEVLGKIDEMAGEIERGLIYGSKFLGWGAGSANDGANMMGGLVEEITVSGGTILDMQGTVTQAKFDGALASIAASGGKPNVIHCNAVTKQTLTNALNDVQKYVDGINPVFTGGRLMTGYLSGALGYELEFVDNPYLKNGDVLVLDDSNVKLSPTQENGIDDLFVLNDDASDSSKLEDTLRSIITAQFFNAYQMAYITGVTA